MAEVTVNRFFIFRFGIRLAVSHNCRYNPQSMNLSNTTISNKSKDRPTLLAACLFFSILLHLLMVFYLRYHIQTTESLIAELQEPTIVRLIDQPPETKPKEYELDQRPTDPTVEPPPEVSRLAEQNQRVDQEMAPKGDDVRDQTAQPAYSPPAAQAPPESTATDTKKQTQQPKEKLADSAKRLREQEETPTNLPQSPEPTPPLPSLQQLTQLTPNTINRISRNERERIKQRDVNQGDTVWLNLERGSLISFFRRFRNRIEGVWNYPQEAVYREMQGDLVLKITVDKEGELLDVELMATSGHELLDFEAIQAVYRAAPFGPLGKHYPHPDLKIMANFSYTISGKYIYGR